MGVYQAHQALKMRGIAQSYGGIMNSTKVKFESISLEEIAFILKTILTINKCAKKMGLPHVTLARSMRETWRFALKLSDLVC